MNNVAVQHNRRSWPEVSEFFAGFPSWADLRPVFGKNLIKLNGRSEFSYRSFTRSVTLPSAADEDGIKASYDKGILNITVPLKDSPTEERRIAVEAGG
ncbi:Hsp20/alpha crystallin family protein [Mycolicibacterium sp.]|uniref:Hsp20/alpha crystallin family protein n=1 Tax=Mycolicibacterium sp. TaxID=2320850 RepID=UPI003D124FC3